MTFRCPPSVDDRYLAEYALGSYPVEERQVVVGAVFRSKEELRNAVIRCHDGGEMGPRARPHPSHNSNLAVMYICVTQDTTADVLNHCDFHVWAKRQSVAYILKNCDSLSLSAETTQLLMSVDSSSMFWVVVPAVPSLPEVANQSASPDKVMRRGTRVASVFKPFSTSHSCTQQQRNDCYKKRSRSARTAVSVRDFKQSAKVALFNNPNATTDEVVQIARMHYPDMVLSRHRCAKVSTMDWFCHPLVLPPPPSPVRSSSLLFHVVGDMR